MASKPLTLTQKLTGLFSTKKKLTKKRTNNNTGLDRLESVVDECIDFLQNPYIGEIPEGIFRVPAQQTKISKLDNHMHKQNTSLSEFLKEFIGEPKILVAAYLKHVLREFVSNPDKTKHLIIINDGQLQLPSDTQKKRILYKLFTYLNKLAKTSIQHRMTAANLAMVFTPTLVNDLAHMRTIETYINNPDVFLTKRNSNNNSKNNSKKSSNRWKEKFIQETNFGINNSNISAPAPAPVPEPAPEPILELEPAPAPEPTLEPRILHLSNKTTNATKPTPPPRIRRLLQATAPAPEPETEPEPVPETMPGQELIQPPIPAPRLLPLKPPIPAHRFLLPTPAHSPSQLATQNSSAPTKQTKPPLPPKPKPKPKPNTLTTNHRTNKKSTNPNRTNKKSTNPNRTNKKSTNPNRTNKNSTNGYNPNSTNGYNPNSTNGYNPNSTNGYNPNSTNGYNPNSTNA